MWDSGGVVRGCDLRPGPESCYLDGDNIQAAARGVGLEVVGRLWVYRGTVRLLLYVYFAMVMLLLVNGRGSTLRH
jgi:hypothetical protein